MDRSCGRHRKLTFRERRKRHVGEDGDPQGNVRHSCGAGRGEGGGGFLSLAQPSGFFFVGIGPVGGTSFPFELTATVGRGGGQFYNDNPSLPPSLTLLPPPLLQHHPLNPSRQWTVGPPRGEKLNRERETRREGGREGRRERREREGGSGEISGYIYLKIPFIREG